MEVFLSFGERIMEAGKEVKTHVSRKPPETRKSRKEENGKKLFPTKMSGNLVDLPGYRLDKPVSLKIIPRKI